ncbi:MAG: tRNA-guanine transglycosylase [Candidatus Aenigmatarchaeota archaeon]
MKKFKITHQNGEARSGEIRINGKKLETPFLYPVLAFFCGGNWSSKFGGGIYRQIKENFLMKKKFQKYFSGIMTSIAQLNDFPVTKKKLNEYISKSIHDWFNFDGVLFVDSGGFKLLTNGGIKGQDFEIKSAEEVLYYQKKFGANILVSLDYPISPNLPKNEINKRIEFSISNAVYLLHNKPKNTLTYIAIHGYSKKSLKLFMSRLLYNLEKEALSLKKIDGIALGSLVPLKSNILKILEIVKGCKEVLYEFDMNSVPLHVFGISSTLMPLLVMMGVDTFDSSTYLYSGIKGVYLTKGLKRMNVTKIKRGMCNCQVCKKKDYFMLMKKSSQKIGSLEGSFIAMHNLITFTKEVQTLQEIIKNSDESYITKFIQNRYSHSPIIRKGVIYLIEKLRYNKWSI